MNILYKNPTELKPYGKNAKKHPEDQVKKIANSLQRFGFQQPLVIDKEGIIVVGHGRLMAALQLNLDQVPCVVAENLTKEELKAYRLADNKLNESGWDMGLVIEELKDLTEELSELAGFTFQDLNDVEIVNDPKGEWEGMPEFSQKDQTAYRQILVSFQSEVDVQNFAELIDQNISEKTRFLWFPKAEIVTSMDKPYG